MTIMTLSPRRKPMSVCVGSGSYIPRMCLYVFYLFPALNFRCLDSRGRLLRSFRAPLQGPIWTFLGVSPKATSQIPGEEENFAGFYVLFCGFHWLPLLDLPCFSHPEKPSYSLRLL